MQRLRHVSSHNSFLYLWIVGAVVVLGALGYSYITSHPQGVFDGQHEGDVRTVVAGFGNALSTVSLAAPDVAIQIRTAYAPYVAPELLAVWESDPSRAPGRDTSGPWPDHIVVEEVTQRSADTYDVQGYLAIVASADAHTTPVSITVTRIGGSYLITRFEMQEVVVPSSLESVAVSLGQPQTALGVQITPEELVSDTRCSDAAKCSEEGTVQVRAKIGYGLGTATDALFVLGIATTFDAYVVTLADVMPAIPADAPDQYVFVFRVETR